jgi:hypothetical protein
MSQYQANAKAVRRAQVASEKVERTYRDEPWFRSVGLGFEGGLHIELLISERPDEVFPGTVDGVRLVVQVGDVVPASTDSTSAMN